MALPAGVTTSIELFGVLSNGQLGWSTWTNGTWTAQRLFDPPSVSSFVRDSPGAYCPNGGSIELFVTGTDGAIWWRSMNPSEEWTAQWERVDDVLSSVGSGVSVTGVLPDHWFVFAAAASGELVYAEYDGRWMHRWENLGGTVVGTPAALSSEEGRVDVYALGTDNRIWQRWMYSGTIWSQPAFLSGSARSEPAVIGWNFSHVNILTRSPSNTLQHEMYQAYWTELMITAFSMPAGKPSAVSRYPGSADIFVRQPDGILWHGFWPRKPRTRD